MVGGPGEIEASPTNHSVSVLYTELQGVMTCENIVSEITCQWQIHDLFLLT